MIFDIVLRYPTKLDINKIKIGHSGNADKYVNILKKEIKLCIDVKYGLDMECRIAAYGMIFRRMEISLKENSPLRDHAEYLISSIVQYEPPTLDWVRGNVILRMVRGVTLLKFEHVFAQMLKYNPFIIFGSEVMFTLFRYGTCKMMEIALDLCEPDLIDLSDTDDIPEDAVEIELCDWDPMRSEGGRLFMDRFDETITKYEEEHGFAVVGLRIKKEVIDMYRIDVSEVDEKIVELKKYGTNSKKDKQCIIF